MRKGSWPLAQMIVSLSKSSSFSSDNCSIIYNIQCSTFNLQPSTSNLQPSTFNLQPSTFLSLQIKIFALEKQRIIFEDLGIVNYKAAWDYQEELVKKNLEIKSELRKASNIASLNSEPTTLNIEPSTTNYLLFCEHPPVYTLGKSGHMENVLLSENEMEQKEI